MGYNSCTYAIVPIAELNNITYSEVVDNSADSVRRNSDETEFVVEWEGDTPASVAAINPAPTEYTHENILTEMAKVEWSPEPV